jgi:methionyl-tRNA formyltransferase
MRVLFLGTPQFAVPALRRLIDRHVVCGVFTQPDRPSGRGNKLQPSPVKALAQASGIPVFQPEKIRSEETRPLLRDLKPDCIIAAAYGQIIPAWLLQCSSMFPLNIHASLLPKYRGAAPIARSILNGDDTSGVTIMVIEEALDAGAILLQEKVPISLQMTTGELTTQLSETGAQLLSEALERLETGELKPIPQDETQVSWAPRLTKEMSPISWDKPAMGIHNQIRAMNPWPIANTVFRGEKLNILRSMPGESLKLSPTAPGTLLQVSGNGISIQCGQGTVLDILEVQRPSKGRISGREFASGARLHAGEILFS